MAAKGVHSHGGVGLVELGLEGSSLVRHGLHSSLSALLGSLDVHQELLGREGWVHLGSRVLLLLGIVLLKISHVLLLLLLVQDLGCHLLVLHYLIGLDRLLTLGLLLSLLTCPLVLPSPLFLPVLFDELVDVLLELSLGLGRQEIELEEVLLVSFLLL